MKKNVFVGILIFITILTTGCSSTPKKNASNSGVTIDGKNIAISDVSTVFGGTNKKIYKEQFGKGIFITASGSIFDKHKYPNAEKVVRDRFAMYGIKVVDNLEDADVMLRFYNSGSLNMAEAEKKAEHSNMLNTEQVAINGGALAANVLVNGPVGAVGFAIGALFDIDSRAEIVTQVILKPKMVNGTFGTNPDTSISGGNFTDGINVRYKLEKGKEAGDDIVLKMSIDQWIKEFISFDNNPPEKS